MSIDDRNITRHEKAGHELEILPYDPDYGDNQWLCRTCDRVVVVPGWVHDRADSNHNTM